jgi:hypothetical protein
MKDYYEKSIRALQLAGFGNSTQKKKSGLIFVSAGFGGTKLYRLTKCLYYKHLVAAL